ncbi:SHOCT domain-containing protein [Tranquillimonas alkanivorans]|uniref:Putative membrane protein n=1 Tax=Tranquillimonas alkanivorans TaxID=441119 RepID=A0A1I5KP08_9RHOB|nr:SHOCT domain-containing protein [Tranquillimonas alkanivorans]SFO86819.1 putative membrane protein [Tranquillimonas alkanivorans]
MSSRIARIAAPLTLLAAPAIAQPYNDGYYHHMDGWGFGLMGFGMMILFWGGLAVLIVLAIRWLGDGGGQPLGRKPSPLDTLKERLARGEIDVEDYEARRKILEG